MAGMLSRASRGDPSLGVGPVGVAAGVGVGVVVVVELGVEVLVDVADDVGVVVAAGPGGGATVEQPPRRPSAAAMAVSALDPGMNDGNPTPRPPNELTCSPGALNGWR